MSSEIPLDIPLFRENFIPYESQGKYSNALLEVQYEIGKAYIADNEDTMDKKFRWYALELMLAHLLYIRDQVNAGNNIGVITSGSEGDVSVAMATPNVDSTWTYWFQATPYGKDLMALLETQSAGGFYVGGSRERQAFRGGFGLL